MRVHRQRPDDPGKLGPEAGPYSNSISGLGHLRATDLGSIIALNPRGRGCRSQRANPGWRVSHPSRTRVWGQKGATGATSLIIRRRHHWPETPLGSVRGRQKIENLQLSICNYQFDNTQSAGNMGNIVDNQALSGQHLGNIRGNKHPFSGNIGQQTALD